MHGANIHYQTRDGISMLHVSAQGDNPASLTYFLDKGMSINLRDAQGDTPLHCAAVNSAEISIQYIVANGGNIDQRNKLGQTPLHKAVMKWREHKSSKGIKDLLCKGADRNKIDFEKKKPVDHLPPLNPGEKDDPLAAIIRSALKDEWTFKGDFLMISPVYKKKKKSQWTLICYFCLMILSVAMLEKSTYEIMRDSGTSTWLLCGSQVLFVIACLLCVAVWFSDPGIIKSDPSLNMTKLLESMEASSLCPDCKIVKTGRCSHCRLCNQCVDRFDHHCPWVNNCIGKGNFGRFYSFVFMQTAYLISVIICSMVCKYSESFLDHR